MAWIKSIGSLLNLEVVYFWVETLMWMRYISFLSYTLRKIKWKIMTQMKKSWMKDSCRCFPAAACYFTFTWHLFSLNFLGASVLSLGLFKYRGTKALTAVKDPGEIYCLISWCHKLSFITAIYFTKYIMIFIGKRHSSFLQTWH